MADVARLAGVSHQTVSRVINGQNNLRPATRERVEQAILQLGYRPNSAARALVTRRSATIGVIGSKSGYWGPSTVHRTIQAAGREAGYFVSSANLQSLSRAELVDAIDHLRGQAVEGIVLISATNDALEVARAQEHLGIPVVVVEGDPDKTRWTVASTRSPAPSSAPSTSSTSGTPTSSISPVRWSGPRPAPGCRGGTTRCTPPGCGPAST